jgi:hypothetical protein
MYQTIVLQNGSEWACENGCGVFSRRRDGTWQQLTGTGQTRRFKTPQEFSRYVHGNYRDGDGRPLPRMTHDYNWDRWP